MVRYLIRRLLWAVVLFIAVTMVTYVIFFVIPANPAAMAAGKQASAADIARAEKRLGLDKPVPIQYERFLQRLVINRSLGYSFTNRRDVNEMVLAAAPVTASLVFGGVILWMLMALPIGILSALRPRSLLDRGAMVFVLIGISLPVIWIGLVLQYFSRLQVGAHTQLGLLRLHQPAGRSNVRWAG